MLRQTIIFFFLNKSQPFNKKQPTGTINQIKQSKKQSPQPFNQKQPKNKHDKLSYQSIAKSITQTITTNNPHLSIKNTQRQTQQAITKKCNIFEYQSIPNGNFFRANRKYAFYKKLNANTQDSRDNYCFEQGTATTKKKLLYIRII